MTDEIVLKKDENMLFTYLKTSLTFWKTTGVSRGLKMRTMVPKIGFSVVSEQNDRRNSSKKV